MDRPKLNQIAALRAIAKAAYEFREGVNCFSVGVSLLSEDYMKEKDAALQAGFQALADAIAWDKAHPIDPSRLPPKLTDILAAAELSSAVLSEGDK